MKVTNAEFVKSAFALEHLPQDGRREIAFLGRSNVGKSSLLNSLLGRKGLARTSNTPGRTQSINFFLVNERFYFVDLPGYGYAKVSKSMRQDWGKMAEEYLNDREELSLFVQLVDARHEPTELDLQLRDWLLHHGKNTVVVATKADKLSSNQLTKSLHQIRSHFGSIPVIAYSSETGKGRDELWKAIGTALA
ncbi:MAG: ribosome biogenesis GTP-binding protein YihA/YsxC [Acidobacteriota bacterium]